MCYSSGKVPLTYVVSKHSLLQPFNVFFSTVVIYWLATIQPVDILGFKLEKSQGKESLAMETGYVRSFNNSQQVTI